MTPTETLPAVQATALIPDDPIEAITPRDGKEHDAVEFMLRAIDVLGDLVEAYPDDTEGLARAQLLAAHVKRRLDMLVGIIQPKLVDSMGDQWQLDLAGIGRLQRRSGTTNSEWDHDEVWRGIRSKAVNDTCVDDNGEIEEATRDAIEHTLTIVRDVIAKGGYKKTGLKNVLGLSADEVSTVKQGDRTVQILGAGGVR